MEVVYKLFNDLESNNLDEVEETKKKFAEIFSSAKDNIIVHGMMDYFAYTNSVRSVDVLVKVQSPHDRFIFDRLSEWITQIKGTNKQNALNLFGHIVRKHPTWLHKIANHSLMKDLLKLLKTEKDIIPLMGALLCIINLMPIIPSNIPNYLTDLFEIFAILAAWNCENPSNQSHDYLLVHLQIGLYRYFHRLYGMFPCSFIAFLRQEYILKPTKDKTAIFTHTIKPLLDTVKINPLIVTATVASETQPDRWKKMEPHDVVFECSKFSLDYLEKPYSSALSECQCLNRSNSRMMHNPVPTFDFSSKFLDKNLSLNSFQSLNVSEQGSSNNYHKKPSYLTMPGAERFLDYSFYDNNIWSPSVMVLATPPPTGTVPHTPTPNYTTAHIIAQDGSSPPEAAVEATPETTPMKDPPKTKLPATSSAVRAIWGTSTGNSTPSSPMKKETSPFRFPENQTQYDSNSTQKIIRIVNDRNQSIKKIQSPNIGNSNNSYGVVIEGSSIPNSPVPVDYTTNHPLVENSQEDQELIEINKNVQNQEIVLTDFTSNDCDIDCETESSPCSAGGLHIPDSKSMIEFARRLRMHSHCMDSSYSASTSPGDINNIIDGFGSQVSRLKKSKSWPDIKNSIKTTNNVTSSFVPVTKMKNFDKTKNGTDALKKVKESNGIKLLDRFEKSIIDTKNISTQTLQQWPQFYEHLFQNMFSSENGNENLENQPGSLLTPHALLEKYIAITIKRKQSFESRNWEEMYRDQIQLLNLQLQYERHRREVHAERNRRLLGNSRANRALEQHNNTLRDQVNRQTNEIAYLNTQWINHRKVFNQREQELLNQSNSWKQKYQNEIDENSKLRATIENLNMKINEEIKARKEQNNETEVIRGELFDVRNDMRHALYQADLGQQYRQELTRLQSEMIVMAEIQIKCKEKLSDLNFLKARDMEIQALQTAYSEELKNLKLSLEVKSSQLDTAKSRLSELESQLSRRDSMFTEQKRLLKAAKEEYQEKLDSLEKKYSAQKAIILRMEEHILEPNRNQKAVNASTLSPESDRADIVGSLDHTSPLSLSLASSDGLSASVHSELRNLQALVGATNSNNYDYDAPIPNVNTTNEYNNQPGVSDDIPVPGTSHHHHTHHHH